MYAVAHSSVLCATDGTQRLSTAQIAQQFVERQDVAQRLNPCVRDRKDAEGDVY